MRPVILQIAVTTMCVVLPMAGQKAVHADELFSDSRLDTVFTVPSQTTQPTPPSQGSTQPATVLKNEDLEGFIRAAGFEPKKVADTVFAIEIARDAFRFPVGLTISPNGENLWIGVLLNTVDENTVSPKVLLALMEANANYGPAHFVYSSSGKRIDLNRALRNINLQPADLKSAVDLSIEIALKTADLWSNPTGNGTSTSQPAPPTQQTETVQPPMTAKDIPTPPTDLVTNPANTFDQTPPVSTEETKLAPADSAQAADQNGIEGRWATIKPNGMAFVLDCAADGTYVLAFKNTDGKISNTQGRYTLTADTLTLFGDNGQSSLSGKFIRVDANSFVFITSTTGEKITFRRVQR